MTETAVRARVRQSGATPGSDRTGPRTPLRIALMLESDGPGGTEVLLLQLAEQLRRRGHHVLHVGPDDGQGWLGRRFCDRGFASETFSLRRPIDKRFVNGFVRTVGGLVRTLRRFDVDVVHSHEFTMSYYGAVASKWVGRPHIITHHSNLYFSQRWRRRVVMRWACRNASAVVAVSDVSRFELERGLGLPAGSVGVVYNGVEFRRGDREPVRRELHVHPSEVVVVSLGRMEPRKGHIVLLEALATIGRRRPDLAWRLVIAGQDRYDTARGLREFARVHRIDDRVHLLGHREDISNLLAAGDVFAMPSLHEGLPLALLEAMHAGLPVVATAVGGIPEAVTTDVDGLVVPARDAAALAEALERLLGDTALRRTLSDRGRRRAQSTFSVEAMAVAYERLYLASGASAPASSR